MKRGFIIGESLIENLLWIIVLIAAAIGVGFLVAKAIA